MASLAVLVMLLSCSATADETEARAEYEKIMAEIKRAQGRVPMDQLIETAEKRLLEFVSEYPGTPSEGSARVMLGQLYSNTGRGEEAIKQLDAYIEADYEKNEREEQMARVHLGNAYLAEERFAEAGKVFEELAADESLGTRIREMASTNLERIGTLRKLKIGSEAIPFAATDIEGEDLSLSDYRGKVVLLDFWATWCAPCRAEMPNVKEVYSEYHDDGFEIIGVSMDQDRGALDRYIDEENIEWRQIFDGKGWKAELGRLYAVSSIPSTFLLDSQGRIRYKNLRGDDLEKAVEKLVEEKQQ